MISSQRKGVAAATLAAFCWGSTTVMSKQALDNVSPVTLLTLQLLASTVFLWVVILLMRIKIPPITALAPIAMLGLLEPGLAYLLGLMGLTDVSAGSATLILASEAILIVMVSAILFRKIPTFMFVTLSMCAFAGIIMALGLWNANIQENNIWGVTLLFLATLSAAIYVVLSGRIADHYHPIVAVSAQQSIALIAVLIFILPLEHFTSKVGITLPSGFETWFLVITSGILQYGIAFSFYMYALSKISANLAGCYLNLIPVFGLSIAFLTLGETLSIIQLIGATLTILALVLINTKPNWS